MKTIRTFAFLLCSCALWAQQVDYNSQIQNSTGLLSDSPRVPYPDFYAACADAAAKGQILAVTRTWTASTSGTCAASLYLSAKGIIRPSRGTTVKLSGSITGGTNDLHFDISAGGSFAASPGFSVQQFLAQWAGVTSSTTVDQSSAVQAAFIIADSLGLNQTWFGAGPIALAAPARMPGGMNAVCQGPDYPNVGRSTDFYAIRNTNFSMLIPAAVGSFDNAILNCGFDANRLPGVNGIDLYASNNMRIVNNRFFNFTTTGSPIRGGGALYTNISENVCNASNAGFCIDVRNSYSPIVKETYYGINVGEIYRNIWSSRGGSKMEGNIHIERNDIEISLNSGFTAALDVSCAVSECFLWVDHNYFELARGNASRLVAIDATAVNKTSVEIAGNQIIGDGSDASVCIVQNTNGDLGSFSLTANEIRNWAVGLNLGTFSTNYNPGILIAGNTWRDIVSPYSYITNESTRNQTTNPGTSPQRGNQFFIQDPAYGNIFSGALVPGASTVNSGSTIDVSRGNIIELNESAVFTGITGNLAVGNLFILTNFKGSTPTLPNSVFGLSAGRDVTLPPGFALTFVIGQDGKVHEVGNRSMDIPTTVGKLGSASTAGNHAWVIDSKGPGGAQCTGGGGALMMAIANGTAWICR